MTQLPEPFRSTLAKHAIKSALEFRDENVEIDVPKTTNVEVYNGDAWNIDHVAFDGAELVIEAKQKGAEIVNNSHNNHPADDKTYDGTAHLWLHIDWSENHLAGEGELFIEYEGGRPDPPDPEPYDI